MKRVLIVALVALAASAVAFGQANGNKGSKGDKASVEEKLIEMEKQAWEAWKNKNGKYFMDFLADDAVLVSGTGVESKTSAVQAISNSTCVVKSYSLENFKVLMLDNDAAILTYSAKQDFTCNGKAGPPQIWASSVYVKRNGKWQGVMHQETAPEPGM